MIKALTPQQAKDLIAQGAVDIVDVRETHEWLTGHLAGARHVPRARHVPLDVLRANPRAALPRDGVLFVCAAGVRSLTAARVAEGVGLKVVYNLSSGTRGWVNAGLPLERELSVAV
jgi:rhodanese-related sulfurtransferase